MKMIGFAFCLLGLVGIAASCAGSDEQALLPIMENRIVPEDAINRVSIAQCEHEEKCSHVGPTKKYQTPLHCLQVKKEEVTTELANDDDCRNGISNQDLDECLTQIRDEDCTGVGMAVDVLQIKTQCGSSQLCLD